MKKIFTLAIVAVAAINMHAKEAVLDLSGLTYEAKANAQVWDKTYAELTPLEVGVFSISHIPSGEYGSYGGTYWDGFTAVKCADNGKQTDWITNQWGVMAEDGTATTLQPYLLGYWSAWTENCNEIKMVSGAEFEAKSVKVSTPAYVHYACKEGSAYNGAFSKEGDNTKLVVTGYDATGASKSVEIALAEYANGAFRSLTSWTDLDLSSLGKVSKLVFTMTSTSVGDWGINTPTYFAIKELTVDEVKNTGITDVETKQVASVTYVNLNGQQSAAPFPGVNIVKTAYTDGTTHTTKLLK